MNTTTADKITVICLACNSEIRMTNFIEQLAGKLFTCNCEDNLNK